MPTDTERLDWLEAHGMPGFRGFIDERMRPAKPTKPENDGDLFLGSRVIVNLDKHRLIKNSAEGWLVECKIVGKEKTADVWFRATNGCRLNYKFLYVPMWVWEAKKLTIGEIEVDHVPIA